MRVNQNRLPRAVGLYTALLTCTGLYPSPDTSPGQYLIRIRWKTFNTFDVRHESRNDKCMTRACSVPNNRTIIDTTECQLYDSWEFGWRQQCKSPWVDSGVHGNGMWTRLEPGRQLDQWGRHGGSHRRRRRGQKGICTPPPKKNPKKVFFSQMSCKIRAFCWFFMHIFSGKNVLLPTLTERLRLWMRHLFVIGGPEVTTTFVRGYLRQYEITIV